MEKFEQREREQPPRESIAAIELKGQRAEQQDAHAWAEYERPHGGSRLVLAIADGHGDKGEKAAKYAAERATHELGIAEHLDAPFIRETFLRLNDAIVDEVPTGGTTLTLGVREGNKLTTAYVGNSEAWLFKDGKLKRRTVPHTYTDNKFEHERLNRTPAHIDDRGRITTHSRLPFASEATASHLSVTRSLGDQAFEPYVLHEPKVETIQLDGTETFLLVGSDGFWNAATLRSRSRHAIEHVLKNASSAEEARLQLLDILARRELHDNATVLIAKL